MQDVFARPSFNIASSEGGWAPPCNPSPLNTAPNASAPILPMEGVINLTLGSVMESDSPEDVITFTWPSLSIVLAGIKVDSFLSI